MLKWQEGSVIHAAKAFTHFYYFSLPGSFTTMMPEDREDEDHFIWNSLFTLSLLRKGVSSSHKVQSCWSGNWDNNTPFAISYFRPFIRLSSFFFTLILGKRIFPRNHSVPWPFQTVIYCCYSVYRSYFLQWLNWMIQRNQQNGRQKWRAIDSSWWRGGRTLWGPGKSLHVWRLY